VADRVLSGRYRIEHHLARGGMAEVYMAEDQLLSRTVAVKVLFPELAQDDQFVERFRREARAAASLNHHNIVSVYDFGEDESSWFIVMEYVNGPTLRDIIRDDGAMDPAKAADIGAEVAAALAAAHAQGIVHRDVKPANVLIAAAGGTVKVADFGIARAANARQGLTMPGTVLGTATYLSPEQAQGHPVDHRTDIYSLGMVLYEMLAGRPPFKGDSPVAVAYQSVRDTPPPPSTHNSRVTPALDAVVMKAMAKDPAGRQQSAEELRSELLAAGRAVGDPDATVAVVPPLAGEATTVVAAGPSTSILPPPAPLEPMEPAGPVRRPVADAVPASVYRRRRAAVIGGLAVLALLLIVVLVALNGGGGAKGTVAVPDVVGRSVSDAQAALDQAGLKSSVTPQQRAGTPDQVLAQNPAANTQVSRGSSVELIVPLATATSAPSTTPTVATTRPTTSTTATTVAPTTTAAPATTVATTVPPTTSIVVPTSVVVPTTVRP
jgi:tRNA A-37 threonylcarbamoyl transferase component Bud32